MAPSGRFFGQARSKHSGRRVYTRRPVSKFIFLPLISEKFKNPETRESRREEFLC